MNNCSWRIIITVFISFVTSLNVDKWRQHCNVITIAINLLNCYTDSDWQLTSKMIANDIDYVNVLPRLQSDNHLNNVSN